MKIEIEFTSSYEAIITIDGRILRYCLIGKNAGLTGLKDDELEGTIGGLVAGKLTEPLCDILQAWMPDEESPDDDCWETWEKLSDRVADEIARKLG